jgi:hypothetical protein
MGRGDVVKATSAAQNDTGIKTGVDTIERALLGIECGGTR